MQLDSRWLSHGTRVLAAGLYSGAFSTAALLAALPAQAQTVTPTAAPTASAAPTATSPALPGVTNEYEGVSGDIDNKRRSPVVSVRTEVNAPSGDSKGSARLLVDAYVPNEDFVKYPLRFDFYINRRLVSSQIRSDELPGPVGLDVPPEIATVPFNFAVVATVLHPNREFKTVFTGAAFTSTLTETLRCSLVVAASPTSAESTYNASQVASSQPGENSYALSFETSNGSVTRQAEGSTSTDTSVSTVTADLRATVGSAIDSGKESSGTLTYEIEDRIREVPVEGTVNLESAVITRLDLESEDGTVKLSCSK